jgi:hypothetical protein
MFDSEKRPSAIFSNYNYSTKLQAGQDGFPNPRVQKQEKIRFFSRANRTRKKPEKKTSGSRLQIAFGSRFWGDFNALCSSAPDRP